MGSLAGSAGIDGTAEPRGDEKSPAQGRAEVSTASREESTARAVIFVLADEIVVV